MVSPSDVLALIRPINSVMIGSAVLVGMAVISPSSLITIGAPLAFMVGFLISSFAMIVNDIYDVEIDRINDPERPLPSGRISRRTGIALASVPLSAGLAISSILTTTNFLIAIIFAIISWGYSFWGKRNGLVGNILVAASMAVPFIFGGVAAGVSNSSSLIYIWSMALMAFLSGTGREVIKGIADVMGDKEKGVRSVALIRGNRTASIIGGGFLSIAVLTSILPYLIQVVGTLYFILVLIPDTIFVYAIARILKDNSPSSAEQVKTLALVGMLAGLVAFVLGGVLRF